MDEPIITALQEQVGCYRRLSKLAEIQHDHVQNNATEKLLDVLGRRQVVLDQISRLEEIIRPAKRGWGEYIGQLEAAQRQAAEQLLAETRRLLEQITSSDKNDALVLQQRKLNLGKQIQQAGAARTINKSYAAAAAYGKRAASRVDIVSR